MKYLVKNYEINLIIVFITGLFIHAAFKSHLWVPISHSSSSVQAGPESNLAEYPSSQRQVNDPMVLLQTPFPHTSFSLHSLMSIQLRYYSLLFIIAIRCKYVIYLNLLPIQDEPSAPLSKPPEQEHRKLPIVLLQWPPLQILGLSSHSFTSAHVRLSANKLNPVLCNKQVVSKK